MKKICIFFNIIILLTICGCKSFYVNQAIKAQDRNFEIKLPKLEPIFENETEVKYWKPGEKIVRLCDKYHSADASKMPKGFYQGALIKGKAR